jgi:mRNA interferase RelE/StbE
MSLIKASSHKWTVKFTPAADKQLEKMDPSIARSINRYILYRLVEEDNPRRFGNPLTGNLKEYWRYRIGDYRLVCEIVDHELLIVAVRVAHRREVYKNVHFLQDPPVIVVLDHLQKAEGENPC